MSATDRPQTPPTLPPPVEVPYDWREREAPIELYSGELELEDKEGRLARGTGVVHLRWRPQPAIRFVIEDEAIERDIGTRPRIRIRDLELRADVNPTRWSPTGGEIRGVINRASFPAAEAITELRFVVANFLSFRGSESLWEERPLPGGGTTRSAWAGRVVLEADPWRLTLDSRSDARETKARLKDEGGYEVTHIASLHRQDKTPFSDVEARDALLACAHFFGLVRGQWAPPLIAIGLDEQGSIIWRDWSPPTSSSWRGALHAFDELHPECLPAAFAGFVRTWQNDVWKQPLLYATQMYVEANGPVYAETALVLTQAALELLSWVRFVEELGLFTAEEFDKIEARASGRLRELLKWHKVDPAIPDTLPALQKEAGRHGWSDGPHAVDAMRNALVHPSKRMRIDNTDLRARIELHDLALWYVELALLGVIGYEGAYLNRLGIRQTGVVEPVPWAT